MSASTMPDWILFSLHWLVSLFGRMMASFSSLETKDFATLAVSLIALIVSVVSVRQSISSRKKDAERSARAEFAEIVETMVDLRQKREDIRRELGVEWGKNNNVVTRININDKRELLISRAAYLLHNFDINVSDIQYTIVGVAVVDAGRPAKSLQYFRKSLEVCSNPVARAVARRGYGRTLILSGNLEEGRTEMLAAADEFARLAAEPGLDAERMRYSCAETFQRLIWVGLDLKDGQAYLEHDYDKLVQSAALIRNRDSRKQLEDAIKEVDNALIERGITKSGSLSA